MRAAMSAVSSGRSILLSDVSSRRLLRLTRRTGVVSTMAVLPAPGTRVADRFEIETVAGEGGMGVVFRARDSLTGQRVALKLLHASVADPQTARRFAREAALLADLRAPGIVAYVTYGLAEDNRPFLAMEWLEGEDLSQRLARQPLTSAESVALIRGAAHALSAAHRTGVVHRDIKPSNIFLRDGRIDDVVLLDFGIAHHAAFSRRITGTGVILGTPGYMAPEQAAAHHELTPAADIFALGCVLYECLAGQPPFTAPHLVAVLAKILYAEPTMVQGTWDAVAPALLGLLRSMLAKAPAERPGDAAALAAALDALPLGDLGGTTLAAPPAAGRRALAEQQLVSVMLASVLRPCPGGSPGALDMPTAPGFELKAMRAGLAARGADLKALADGSLVATLLPRRGVATDQAVSAARCALMVKELWPEASVAVSTGRGVVSGQLPMGEAMDRAGQLLSELRPERAGFRAQIVLDEVTAGLLGARFRTSQADAGAVLLHGEQLHVDESHPLLGKPTPCVGREQELATLELALAACVDGPSARAVLVTGEAGLGKSRLRHEFVRRVARREDEVLILIGRGDPMGVGSPHGLLSQAVQTLCGFVRGEDTGTRRDKLRRRVARHLAPADAQEVVEFMGELCDVESTDEPSARLLAARGDPRLMKDRMSQAVLTFFEAECAAHPVLLVLEDLHWGDALTVELVGELLRGLSERPCVVLALARPEVKERFPELWGGHAQEIPLRELSRKASRQLVRLVLGREVEEPVLASIVEQAAGNALYLEELIRATAEGKRGVLPDTVLAMLQARILHLTPVTRQAVLAASVFGRTFWARGIRALISDVSSEEDLDRSLDDLVQLEVIERQHHSRFPSEVEYRFRHVLVRDAAYGLLLAHDVPLIHQRAGAYLEEMGEPDPLVLAEHYHLGGQADSAVRFYIRAAERLFERHDLQGGLRCVAQGVACGAIGQALSILRALQASAAFWMDDVVGACTIGMPILSQLPAGSYQACKLIASLTLASAQLGKLDDVMELSRLMLETTPEPGATTAYVEAAGFLSAMATWIGWRAEAALFLERMRAAGAEEAPVTRGWLCTVHGAYTFFFGLGLWQVQRVTQEGIAAFRQAGDHRNSVAALVIAALAQAELGERAGAETTLRECCRITEQVGQLFPMAFAKIHLIHVLADSACASHRQEARALALAWVTSANPNQLHLGVAHNVIARVEARDDDLEQAEAHAQRACELLAVFRPYRLFALTTLSAVLLARGRAADAQRAAALGVQILEEIGGACEVELRLLLAESCYASGEGARGDEELGKCVSRLRACAAEILEDGARERYLREVPANMRAIALARSRLGDAGDEGDLHEPPWMRSARDRDRGAG
ncbi:protein kinase [Sorangium sp. So ce1014]|uniref:protein kinase domain-containing protein n=1 Tax=Sorangium sp. So ce1014 TaxID=3133326 RepID=UPI003F5E1C46